MFTKFSHAVHARYNEMAKGELFTVDTEDLFTTYLLAFPEGTNPILRVNTEHECSCCKNFVRNIGNVVSIDPVTLARTTVWGDFANLPEPYATVSKHLDMIVSQAPIKSVYRTKEKQYGTEYNWDRVTNKRWDHFWGRVSAKHLSASPGEARGDVDANFQVLNRGLEQITIDHLDTVLGLIDDKALYRGEEHRKAVKAFRDVAVAYAAADDRQSFVWVSLDRGPPKFRNTAIGSLLVALAEGEDLEKAVKQFESKVAPQNYKRPTALITSKMIDDAVATLDKLGLSTAVHRRMARVGDISVNDVLFIDNSARGKTRDGLAGLLDTAVKPKTVDIKHAEDISIGDFMSKVVPSATALDVLVDNRHLANFVTLTGADGDERLFKWGNNFAWSYDGDVADSLRQRVAAAGGRVDGVLRFSHQWNDVGRNTSLMDLHVFMPGSSSHRDGMNDHYPSGQRVGWNRRNDPISGGVQDVDYTNAAPEGYVPVENITFPSMSKLKEGTYTFKIHNWSLRHPTTSGFKAEIEFGGQVFSYEHPKPLGQKEWVTVATAVLKDGIFNITHALPTSTSSREKWGIATQTLVPVDMVMTSPNYWDGAGDVGNKHMFFMLKGCRNPDAVRGIYNEFLRGDLDKHSRVFEVLGSKTKCASSDDQLSGVGFSSTRSDEVTIVVNGRRAYNVKF